MIRVLHCLFNVIDLVLPLNGLSFLWKATSRESLQFFLFFFLALLYFPLLAIFCLSNSYFRKEEEKRSNFGWFSFQMIGEVIILFVQVCGYVSKREIFCQANTL